MNFFALLVLGHLVGDYLFQNKWMAMNKKSSWFPCFVHCFIYTTLVTAFTFPALCNTLTLGMLLLWPMVVFLTHYPIDYYGLADKWLSFINGRSLIDFMDNGHKNIPQKHVYGGAEIILNKEQTENYHILRGGFTAIIYTVADNTMHLVLMYWAYCLIK